MNMEQRKNMAAVLKKAELLSHLSDPELELLAERTVRKIFSGGELLFSEGEPCRHQELANHLGTVRELVSRNLMRLQAEGLLEVDARQIVVKDIEALSALLDVAA